MFGFFLYETFFFNKIWLGVVFVLGRCSCLIVIMHEAEYCQVGLSSLLSAWSKYIKGWLQINFSPSCVPD